MNYKYVEMDYKLSKFEIMLIMSAMVDVVIWVAVLSACLHIWNWIFNPASIDSGVYYMQ